MSKKKDIGEKISKVRDSISIVVQTVAVVPEVIALIAAVVELIKAINDKDYVAPTLEELIDDNEKLQKMIDDLKDEE